MRVPMAGTTRKGHAASVRRQSRQRLRSDRRYRRNRLVRFYRHLVRTGSAFPRLHPKGTSSRFALRAPRAQSVATAVSLRGVLDSVGVSLPLHPNSGSARQSVRSAATPLRRKRVKMKSSNRKMTRCSLSKKSLRAFLPSCFQNCKINFCIMILQFCRCGGLLNAKGHPDGFLSHYPSLRSFWLGSFLTVCARRASI